MLIFKLAFRGLWRHKIRTGITLMAIAFGLFMMIVFMGMSDGSHEQMIELGVRQASGGHVVVQADGYQEERAVELLVNDPEKIRKRIMATKPRAKTVFRAFGGGLAKTSSNVAGLLFMGVEPRRERHISDLPGRIVKGVYLHAGLKAIKGAEKKPKALWCARPPRPGVLPISQAVLGVQLAKTLKIGLCGKLVIDAQGLADRESAQFRVVGLFKTGNSDLDSSFAQLPIADVQRLLHLGKRVHQVSVFVGAAAQGKMAAKVLRKAIANPELKVLPWDKALPELAEFIWLDDASMYVFIIIIFVIVGIGVLNTILMSVMEQTREFGLMRALGAGPWRIVGIVMTEAALLGVLGVIVGLAAGLPLNNYFETTGIDINKLVEGGFEGAGVAITGVIHSKLYLSSAVLGTLSVFGMALVAAVYPAIRAAQIKVLKAIHHV